MGTAERDKSMLKTAGVKVKLLGRTRNAMSDGAFAATPMNAKGCDHHLFCNEQSGRKG